MAEETKKPVEEVVVPEAEKGSAPPVPQPAEAEKVVETTVKVEEEKDEVVVVEKKIEQQVSFKEETNVVSELPEFQKKALDELKKLIQDALEKHEFSSIPKKVDPIKIEEPSKTEEPQKTEEPCKTEEPQKTEEPTKVDEPTKTEEPTKVEEPLKTEEPKKVEPTKTEEPKKVDEPLKTEEPKKVEPLKTEEPKKTEDPTKTEEPKKAEEVKVEVKKQDEDIKETIVVEVPGAVAAAPAPEESSSSPPPPPPEAPKVEPEEVTIWGIPLLLDERTDVILLKFLRARDFKVKEAFTMIRNTARWRKEYNVDSIIDEDLGNEYERVVFTNGVDKHGRIVCYNVFGEFQNKELYNNTFSDGEKRSKFLRWLIQFLEKIIRGLDFSPKGINSFVLVNDLKNSPGFGKREIYKVIDKFLGILQDNYPEFAAKQLCINVSWWYLAYNWIYLTVFTPRSKSKFVFASPSKTAETLFKYIAPEQVPVQFGGHSKIGEHEFSTGDAITEVTIKPGGKHPIEFSFSEETELVWELRVIGWDVTYGAEFLPAKEGGYTLNIAKPKKVAPTDEPVICDTFKVTEAGKVVITIDNQSSKKRKLLYRSKVKASK